LNRREAVVPRRHYNGKPPDFRFGWFADAIPGTAGTPEAHFLTPARLTGIDVFSSAGRAVMAFSVTSGCGTRYDVNGLAQSVPEPGSVILFGIGLIRLWLVWYRTSEQSRAQEKRPDARAIRASGR
jgi:hypothetical protein